jgi:hypothetical protein
VPSCPAECQLGDLIPIYCVYRATLSKDEAAQCKNRDRT